MINPGLAGKTGSTNNRIISDIQKRYQNIHRQIQEYFLVLKPIFKNLMNPTKYLEGNHFTF